MRAGPLLVAVAAVLLLGTASAAVAEPSYVDANQAYLEGEWKRAAEQYEALTRAGVVHPDLYYNLGNAYFRMGRLGPAIYSYERALRLEPDFADARHNLALARDTVAARWDDRVEGAAGEPTWVRLATLLPGDRLALLFLLVNALFFGGLISIRFLSDGPVRIVVKVASAFSGAATATLAVLLALQIWYFERTPVGIVLDDEVKMLEGRDPSANERWVIHAGLEVRVTGREGDWLRVELANGTEGWVPGRSIGELD